MNNSEKQSIHSLFETGNFRELYQTQADMINEMLFIENWQDFEDFLDGGDLIEEDVFWMYYAAVHGESLLIGGYDGDVTEKVTDFLRNKLPGGFFLMIREQLQNLYVDMDGEDNLEEKIGCCNQCLAGTEHVLQLDFDDTYCAGVWFLSMKDFSHQGRNRRTEGQNRPETYDSAAG